jgi:GDPmannose 4,6-dehydratase
LYLGNLNAKRDWGFAPEYVEIMWRMLQQNEPDDYVVGTGESHSVREFVEKAFAYAGIQLGWEGQGSEEKGIAQTVDPSWKDIVNAGDVLVEIDPKYFRPTEVEHLQADSTKAKTRLKWVPRTTFDELVKIMMDYDLKMVHVEPPGEGMRTSEQKGFEYTNHDFSFYEKIRERS